MVLLLSLLLLCFRWFRHCAVFGVVGVGGARVVVVGGVDVGVVVVVGDFVVGVAVVCVVRVG